MACPRSIPVDHIKAIVARHFKISVLSLESAARTKEMIKPRFMAIALCKELTKLSLPQIARRFGNRDHTTILHAIREVKRRYQAEYERLLEIVKASYAAYNDDREDGGQLLFWLMLFAWDDVNKRPSVASSERPKFVPRKATPARLIKPRYRDGNVTAVLMGDPGAASARVQRGETSAGVV